MLRVTRRTIKHRIRRRKFPFALGSCPSISFSRTTFTSALQLNLGVILRRSKPPTLGTRPSRVARRLEPVLCDRSDRPGTELARLANQPSADLLSSALRNEFDPERSRSCKPGSEATRAAPRSSKTAAASSDPGSTTKRNGMLEIATAYLSSRCCKLVK